jgi:hypothetical protein
MLQYENLEPFRIHVSRLGSGYLAESEQLALSIAGNSAADATEKAREAAADIISDVLQAPLPGTLFARIDEDNTVAFVMRPFAQPFRLTSDCGETFYVDSDGRSQPS